MAETRVFVRYVPNNDEFRKHMMGDEVSDVAERAARDVVLAALPIAPRSEASEKGQGDGTRYVEHFDVERTVTTLKDGQYVNPRRSARVVNDSDYAAQVEFGIGPGWSGSRPQGGHHGTPGKVLAEAGRRVGKYKGGVE